MKASKAKVKTRGKAKAEAPPGTYVLRIDRWHPATLNSFRGRHWSAEHRAKRRAAEVLWAEALVQGVPKATGRRRVRLCLTGWPTGRLPDADAFDKVTLDSLVRAGLLLDDGEKGLAGRMAVELVRGPKAKTEIVLEDVDR